LNYYERHIGDYLRDTSHLSLLEHGIYTRLLDVYYTREEPLLADHIARLIGAKTPDELEALETVLNDFFKPDALGNWVQQRCEREIERYQDKIRKAKASADARWGHTERNATAMPTHSEGNALQSPVSIPHKEKKSARKRATPLPQEFRISVRVADWYREKGYSVSHAVANLEAFVSYVKRKGATYVDWDEALMTAIRENWAKVGQPGAPHLATVTVPGAEPWKPEPVIPQTPEQKAATAQKLRELKQRMTA
jgi:uncharacterized protein YdaU (DUF1376 family)